MINLLPPDEKKQLRAARANILLLRYNALTLLAIAFLAGALSVVYLFLSTQLQTAEATIKHNSEREGAYQSIKRDAEAFRNELVDAKRVLNSQVSYSQATVRLSSLLPAGASLKDSLELNESTFSGPITLNVKIKEESVAASLLESFRSSPYVSSVTRNKISIGDATYPYLVEMTVSLKREIAIP